MYTLKIKWARYETDEQYAIDHPDANPQIRCADETTLFIPADEVSFGSQIKSLQELHTWEEGSYFDYSIPMHMNARDSDTEKERESGTRMICVVRGGQNFWYLASHAWLLGPDGKTIEKLTT